MQNIWKIGFKNKIKVLHWKNVRIEGHNDLQRKMELYTQISGNWLRNRICTCACAWCELNREKLFFFAVFIVHIIQTSKNRENTCTHGQSHINTFMLPKQFQAAKKAKRNEKHNEYQMSIENELRQHSMLQRTYETHKHARTYTRVYHIQFVKWLVQ